MATLSTHEKDKGVYIQKDYPQKLKVRDQQRRQHRNRFRSARLQKFVIAFVLSSVCDNIFYSIKKSNKKQFDIKMKICIIDIHTLER